MGRFERVGVRTALKGKYLAQLARGGQILHLYDYEIRLFINIV
jgi:hypothetical protein